MYVLLEIGNIKLNKIMAYSDIYIQVSRNFINLLYWNSKVLEIKTCYIYKEEIVLKSYM